MASLFDSDKYFSTGEWKVAANSASSHYKKLGLRSCDTVSDKQIIEAFHFREDWWTQKDKIARSGQAHPVLKEVGPFIQDAIKNLLEAKSILSDPVRKAQYDKKLKDELISESEECFIKYIHFCLSNGISPEEKHNLLNMADTLEIDRNRAEEILLDEMNKAGAEFTSGSSDADSTESAKPLDRLLNKTYYEILGIDEDADYEKIKEAYDREYVKYTNSRNKAQASARFFVVSEAWDCLKDTVKRREYDEKQKKPKTPPPTGIPRLVVESKTDYAFNGIRRGAVINVDRIVIKNPEGGLLQGTIKSDAPWLEVDRNKLLEMHEQELSIRILTSKIPRKTFQVEGNVTIETNGVGANRGKEIIPFKVILEDFHRECDRFRQAYAPLSAALGGFLFSFGDGSYFCLLGLLATVIGYPIFIYKEHTTSFASIVKAVIVAIVGGFIAFWILEFLGKYFPHFIGFVIGAYLIGGLAYLAADLIMKYVLNAGINLSRFPPILVHGLSAGLVILAIAVHSGDSPSVKKIAEREVTSTTSPQSQKQRIVSSPTTTKRIPKSRVRIKRSVVAAGLNSNNRPVGISTNFSSGLKKLWHFVEYKGAMKNKTVFRCQWYKDGRLLTTISYQLERSSGNAWCPLTHNYKPGKYEVRLFADDNELKRTCFYITKPSKLSPKPKNNIKHSIAEKQSNHSSPQTHSSPVKQSSQTKPGKRLLIPPSRDSF